MYQTRLKLKEAKCYLFKPKSHFTLSNSQQKNVGPYQKKNLTQKFNLKKKLTPPQKKNCWTLFKKMLTGQKEREKIEEKNLILTPPPKNV